MRKYFEINRFESGPIYAITLFGKFIDFRHWYQCYIPDPITKKVQWSDIWFEYNEIEEWLKEEPNLKYRRVNLFIRLTYNRTFFENVRIIINIFVIYVLYKYFRNKKNDKN